MKLARIQTALGRENARIVYRSCSTCLTATLYTFHTEQASDSAHHREHFGYRRGREESRRLANDVGGGAFASLAGSVSLRHHHNRSRQTITNNERKSINAVVVRCVVGGRRRVVAVTNARANTSTLNRKQQRQINVRRRGALAAVFVVDGRLRCGRR